MSGVFTAGIFLPGLIILANLLSGVFTAAGITEPPICHESLVISVKIQRVSEEKNMIKADELVVANVQSNPFKMPRALVKLDLL